jgi:molybdate transport system substrate-binding protein
VAEGRLIAVGIHDKLPRHDNISEALMKHRLSPMAGVWLGILMAGAQTSSAAEVKVLTAGAFKQVVLAVVPEFEKQTGHKVVVDNDTVGGLTKKIEAGAQFDVVVLTPAAIDSLTSKGKITDGSKAVLARVGVGVMVKAGAPAPDIGSVEAFKRALINAKSVAYIDPASGGSSGIYVAGLLDRLGIADQVKPKAKLKQGGYVADLIKAGEAELGIHQISEIVPVKEVTLVGPLPAEIQNYTTYAAGIGAGTKESEAAKALIKVLSGPAAAAVLKEKGMDRPTS